MDEELKAIIDELDDMIDEGRADPVSLAIAFKAFIQLVNRDLVRCVSAIDKQDLEGLY